MSKLLIGGLGLIFVALKLAGFISWSWWWVLLPFYGGVALAVSIILLIFVLGYIYDKKVGA